MTQQKQNGNIVAIIVMIFLFDFIRNKPGFTNG